MKRTLAAALLLGALIAVPAGIVVSLTEASPATAATGLRAGAARIDITPQVADLPAPFKSIHDPIYMRVLVLDDGADRAVIVIGDLPTIAVAEFDDLKGRIAATAHAPVQNVILGVTHAHSAVRIDHVVKGILIPGSPKIADMTMAATIEAVKTATANLKPARAGYANEIPPSAGADAGAGPKTDRSLGVLKVETLAGQPIAFVFNSDLPGAGGGSDSEVSAGGAGAVQRYIEQRFGDKAVAIYTKGASSEPGANNGGRRGGPPTDPYVRMKEVGASVGEEVLAIAGRVRVTPTLKISGAEQALQCPGKSTVPLNTPAQCSNTAGSKLPRCENFTDHDIDPVKLQIGVLKIGDLKLVQTDADITQPVWQRLKGAAPANTALVALVYGPVHYVIEDSVYAANGYQATATMAKKGCAADGFVTTANGLIRR